MEFLSRSDDKKLRWIITESCPQPHLIDTEKQTEQEGEVKGDVEVKGDGEQPQSPSPQNKHQEGAELAAEETHPSPMEQEKRSRVNKPSSRNSWRSRRGRGKGDRGSILLTSLEQEMLLWALGGFQPIGPEGLKPSSEHQVQVAVVPVEKMGGAGVEGARSGDANDGDEPPRKRAKVMLLQVMKKGEKYLDMHDCR